MKVVLLIALIVLVVVIGPLATIWALNTLFPIVNIPYSFDTWAAALLLGGALSFRRNKND
jgi:hypothetical protein